MVDNNKVKIERRKKDGRVNLRISQEEKKLLEESSCRHGMTLSTFMVAASLAAARDNDFLR